MHCPWLFYTAIKKRLLQIEIKVVTYSKIPVDCKSVIKPQQKQDEQNNHQQPWCYGSKVEEVKSATISFLFVFQSKTREAGKRQEKAYLKDDKVNITCHGGDSLRNQKLTFSLTKRQYLKFSLIIIILIPIKSSSDNPFQLIILHETNNIYHNITKLSYYYQHSLSNLINMKIKFSDFDKNFYSFKETNFLWPVTTLTPCTHLCFF